MTMRRKQMVGTRYDPELDRQLQTNQSELVDELTRTHYKIGELLGPGNRIVSVLSGGCVDAQPTQARGAIVWNRAYAFQAHGPSYLDPVPDSLADRMGHQ